MSSLSSASGDKDRRRVNNPQLKHAVSEAGDEAPKAVLPATRAAQGINPLTSAGSAANSDWRPVTKTKLRGKFGLGRKKKSKEHPHGGGLALRQDNMLDSYADFGADAPAARDSEAPRESRLGSALHNVADRVRSVSAVFSHPQPAEADDEDDGGGDAPRPSSGILGMVLNPLAGKTKKNSVRSASKSTTRVFDVGAQPGTTMLKLNTLSLTFQRVRESHFDDAGHNLSCGSRLKQLCRWAASGFDLSDMWSDFELEFQRFHAVQSYPDVRRALVVALLLSLMLVLSTLQAKYRGEFAGKSNRAWFGASIAMLLLCILGLITLNRYHDGSLANYRLQTVTSVVATLIAIAHATRAALNPFQPMSWAYSISFIYPFYLGAFASGLGLTFPFYFMSAAVFSAAHLTTMYYVRENFVSFAGHSDFFKQINYSRDPDATLMQIQVLHSSVDFIWVYHVCAFIVFAHISRQLDVRSRSHFMQLRRLNQLEAPRIKIVVDWGVVDWMRDALLAKFAGYTRFLPHGVLGDAEFEIEHQALVFQQKIGAGASGTVFAGWFGKQAVAIKQLNIDELTSMDPESVVAEAKVEASILAKLRHPNVLEFFGVCNDPSHLFIVTELCSGDLRERIYNAELVISDEEQVRMLREIAQGCAYLHGEGVVHRDLKPGNVLLDRHGTCKICDFGQSKDFRGLRQESKAHDGSLEMTTNVGTPVFAAPELHSDTRRGQYSTKIDVFSFGIIMWTLRARTQPYSETTGLSTFSLLSKIVNGLRPSVPDSFPPLYTKLMRRCWDMDPDKRPIFSEIEVILGRSNLMWNMHEFGPRARGHSLSWSASRQATESGQGSEVMGDTGDEFFVTQRQAALSRAAAKRRSQTRRPSMVPHTGISQVGRGEHRRSTMPHVRPGAGVRQGSKRNSQAAPAGSTLPHKPSHLKLTTLQESFHLAAAQEKELQSDNKPVATATKAAVAQSRMGDQSANERGPSQAVTTVAQPLAEGVPLGQEQVL